MQRQGQDQPIVADFFAQGYRLSGTFVGGNSSLSDVIFDTTSSYLLIKEAYLSPITDPAKISAYHASTILAKHNLDFVMTVEQKDGLRRGQRFASGDRSFDLCLVVPFFEIQGRLQTSTRLFDPRSFLSNDAGVFITLLDVTARCTFSPEISYHGGAALISRAGVFYLGERASDGSQH